MTAQTITSFVRFDNLTPEATNLVSGYEYVAYLQRDGSLVILNMADEAGCRKAQVFLDMDDNSDTMDAWIRRFMYRRPGTTMVLHALKVIHPQIRCAPRGRWFKP